MSMARLAFPSRLELKSLAGSFKEAPLKKVSFTIDLYDSPVQMPPSWDHIGVPIHFHSSTTSGSASQMRARILASVSPLQSPNSAILSLISLEATLPAAFGWIFIFLPFVGDRSHCPRFQRPIINARFYEIGVIVLRPRSST